MLPHPLRVIYLHGFASGPTSRKAQFLAERFRGLQISLETPDLSEANFENLTISRQLEFIDRLIGGEPVSLIGSSLGGYLAALYAAKHQSVESLILLAPAFGFLDLWKARLGPSELQRWQESDALPVYHYARKREVNLRYGLLSDAAQYALFPDFHQPALILHGRADDTVPIQNSIDYAAAHPNVQLVSLDSDHELGNALDTIWEQTQAFLLRPGIAKSVLG